ncbi:5-carboxymethyl-2-hydroxymuconate Delta-isomerase [Acinetobacter sp. ASP199]|uniref:5-carboxymethyl-2-hydroxymuconate Delta-isomerase n=1 Tax=unclassified Acinetobacter TaxID=196816 RepID=UPI001F600B9F|nr:5-carboxymethyl-2-hydroxymuconate Delta-isomerase [Acinetobacter sp. ASP199]UNT58687.1 5-carboxymethyl-2-hydroxymuconate Delta-isomerase [Acinetobacter sp. ASP199]
MPHLHIEYSDNLQNLDIKPMLLGIHQALCTANYIQNPNDLKSRAIRQHDYVIGLDLNTTQAYVHAKVSLLSGRSPELKQAISQCVLEVLQQHVSAQQGLTVQLCVEIVEMPKDCYSKAIV